MRWNLLFVLTVVLGAAEPAAFQMTNGARTGAFLDRLLAAPPGPGSYADQDVAWLFGVSTAADQDRHYDLAEAALRRITERWPFHAFVWANLSCCQGKQGKFAEALASVAEARQRPGHNQIQLDGIEAVWRWQLGEREQATALIAGLRKPRESEALEMWLACSAFYHTSCDGDLVSARQAIEELLALPGNGPWRIFLARDVAFDVLRQKSWFVALLGETATGEAPSQPFVAVTPHPGLPIIRELAGRPDETAARVEVAATLVELEAGRWISALDRAEAALHLADLPDARILKALALAGLDRPVAAMDALREIGQRGFRLGAGSVDLWALIPLSRQVLERLASEYRDGLASERSLALAQIIASAFDLIWRGYDRIIPAMDAAEGHCPDLAEIPSTRAVARLGAEDFPGAWADLLKAIALDPDCFEAWLTLATCERNQGDPQRALALFAEAQRHGATYPGIELQQAVFLGAAGDFDAAFAILDAALAKAEPRRDLATACWLLSSECAKRHRYADAERLTRMVLILEPTQHDAWTKLSGDLGRQGKFREAADCARRHLDGDPDAYDGRLALASWLLALGERDDAFALAAGTIPPAEPERLAHYHAIRVLYGAALENEAMVREELAAMDGATPNPQYLRWTLDDTLLDGFREQDWFKQLETTARRRVAEAATARPAPPVAPAQ